VTPATPPTLQYELISTDGLARSGLIRLRGREIKTPVFMPVGTNATVKALTVDELKEIGFQLILGNTYHLHLRPGDETIARLGGLHAFMNWNRCILTDSGGFQIFSLGKLNKISEEGVLFQNHLDGGRLFLTPEYAVAIQENLGSDIMMVLDECLPIPSDRDTVRRSIELTARWAKRSLEARTTGGSLFAIVQGGEYRDLRLESAQMLIEMDFDGFAIGGLSGGESKEVMTSTVSLLTPVLPDLKPRYLMGVGDPVDVVNCVGAGIDMFDCVMPTRNARNGSLFTHAGKISIKQERYKEDPAPIDSRCACSVCRSYSRAYLRHLYKANEILASRLNSYHNLWFMRRLLSQARRAIEAGRYRDFKQRFLATYQGGESSSASPE
jgi:queuine tRNA-ribosyltransferase